MEAALKDYAFVLKKIRSDILRGHADTLVW
jgi:hypothetical protein